MAWFDQECQLLLAKYRDKPADDQLYLGFSSGWKLKPKQQGVLRMLAQWREATARTRNIPKTFIAKDAQLYALVEKAPKSRQQLQELGFQGSQIRRYGDALIEQVRLCQQQASEPDIRIPRPLSKSQQKDYKVLRDVVASRAGELNLPADLLASKAQLVNYLKARSENRLQQGSPFAGNWREQQLQPALDRCPLPTNNNNEDEEMSND
jgi:ribonuclease D